MLLLNKNTKEITPIVNEEPIVGKILVHNAEQFHYTFKKPKYQLWRAETNWGYNPNSGSVEARFVSLVTFVEKYYSREDFLGTITNDFAQNILKQCEQ